MHRRQFLGRAAVVGAALTPISRAAAQSTPAASPSAGADYPLTNASFITQGRSVATPAANPAASPDATPAMPNITGYILGDPSLPNRLQYFADYRCPHCRVFHGETEPMLLADFVETGKLAIELLDFPVIGLESLDDYTKDDAESVLAAEAAASAAEQDAFLTYRNELYQGPERLEVGDFMPDNLIAIAESLGLDVAAFTESLTSRKYTQSMVESAQIAILLGSPGTPSFAFNRGQSFGFPGDYEEFKTYLDSLLGG